MPISSASPIVNIAAPFRSALANRSTLIYGGTLLGLALGMWMICHGQLNLLVAIGVLAVLLLAFFRDPSVSILLCVAYLILMGDIRRIVDMASSAPKLDPLLLVTPLFCIILSIPILMQLRLKDSLSKAVLGLMAVMLLEVFNPKQGGLAVGAAGAMFYIVPLLWFWVGRRYGTLDLLRRLIIGVVLPLAFLAACLGIYQTFVGFLPWEQAWIDASIANFRAMNLGNGFIRAFGFAVNPVEFVGLLMVGCTASMSLFFSGRRVYGPLVPLFAFVIFLSSQRTAVLLSLFAMALTWALSSRGGRGWGIRLIFALVLGLGALAFSVTKAAQSSSSSAGAGNSAFAASASHQVQGLSDPTHSTAGGHLTRFGGGIMNGFTTPIGYGLGFTSVNSSKFGGDSGSSGGGSSDDDAEATEIDVSDMFVSCGVVGGLLYLYVIFLFAQRVVRFSRTAPRIVSLPAVGIVACTITGWLAAGRYSMTAIVWILLGGICKFYEEDRGVTPASPLNSEQIVNLG